MTLRQIVKKYKEDMISDALRQTSVVAKEAGGITQHVETKEDDAVDRRRMIKMTFFLGMLLTRKERSLNITQKHQSVVRKRCHKNLYDTYKRFFMKILTFIALKLGHIRLCI
ncbi:hypothetical protein CUMW_197100 [Citrus unshiu]|nr:hypothetical protein CUMW_197100 [Citrus unshiu]